MPVLKVRKDGKWEEVGSSSFVPQPDWNQNDTSALDYIKNRTHYTEKDQDGSEIVHKLDEKYIPDDFAKTADLEKYATTSQLSSLRTDVNKKMMQNNPMGLGSFSMNGSGLVGERAVEVNGGNQATGIESFAQGSGTMAWGVAAHSEGANTKARGVASHAEGYFSKTKADAKGAHAEGEYATACTPFQHAEGRANVEDEDGTYAHIVGNGTDDENRSNAYALDWQGNGWFAGDVYVGSTSGIDKDEGSKKLATEDFVTEKIEDTTPADIGAAPESHGNHVPEVQTTDNATFLRNDNTWQKITPENIGAINKNASNTMNGDLHYYGHMYINRNHNGWAKTVGNDTDPHVAKIRNSSLNAADTVPTEDGTICWTYK